MNIKIKSKIDVIKKVLAYTSLDIDTSSLYSEMVLAASTSDPVQKKMVYHYLCHYARVKPDLAMMCINTLQKDCRDQDPMIRGLALRSLCSLRLADLSEYAMVCLRSGLKDSSAYVRKTAILCCSKIFSFLPKVILEGDLVDVMYSMLRDSDPQVVTNAVLALDEILASEGGMAINSKLMLYLLNRLHEFSEWGQCSVMGLACRYTPSSDEERFDILNLLENRLKHSNSAVVMATTKLFLHLTSDAPELQQEVSRRMIAPLITHMSVGSPETSFAVLSHIKVLVSASQDRSSWGSSFKHFFCLQSDSVYVRQLKMDVLTLIANPTNALEIVFEVTEYVSSRSELVACHAVRTIAKVAVHVPSSAGEAVDALLQLLDAASASSDPSVTAHVSAECLVACRDILRKYPQRYVDILPAVQALPETVTLCTPSTSSTTPTATITPSSPTSTSSSGGVDGSYSGRAAYAWIIGEFGDTDGFIDAPYLLEDLLSTWAQDTSSSFRLELLTALVKLFFKRPPEVRSTLGRALALAVADEVNIEVRDKGIFYYRLLASGDVRGANAVVNTPKAVVEEFYEDSKTGVTDILLKEFDSFSVVYAIPESKFPTYKRIVEAEQETPDMNSFEDDVDEIPLESHISDEDNAGQKTYAVTEDDTTAAATGNGFLQAGASLDPDTFQSQWSSLPENEFAFELNAERVSGLESTLNAACIYTMASGEVEPGTTRYFFYSKFAEHDGIVLLQLTVEEASGSIQGIVKTTVTPEEAATFMQYFGSSISALL